MNLLFTKAKIGSLTLKNRLIMTAIHTGLGMQEETAFLTERAQNGPALVTAVMGVHPSAANHNMEVLNETNKVMLAEMANQIDRAGSKLCVQLFHVGRNAAAGALVDDSAIPCAPSAVPSPIFKTIPKELCEAEIEDIYTYFSKAAKLCQDAGVHVVEISCSAGYLLSGFLSEKTNLRTDQYGGSRENRERFPLRVIQAVREAVGDSYPVILRISGSDMLGGYTVADMQLFCQSAEPYIDAVNVTGGWHEAHIPQITMQLPPGGFAFLAAAIKQAVNVPVIACNRINNPEIAEEILQEGFADFIGGARAYLADSRYAYKIENNLPYKHCIGCNKGCIENVLKSKPVTCIFNPMIGHEAIYHEAIIKQAPVKEKILIMGGGPGGLCAAQNLALMGHHVTLCTKESTFGGTMNYAKKAPEKEVIGANIEAMVYEAKDAGVKLLTETFVDIAYIEKNNPDRVIVATGSEEWMPPIEGIDGAHVYSLKEVFDAEGETLHQFLKKKVCIIGGGASGIELAYYILNRSPILRDSRTFLDCFDLPETKESFLYSGNITVVEMGAKIGADLGASRWIFMKQIARYPLTMMTQTQVLKITENYVEVLQDGETKRIPAELVVIATGYRPAARELIQWLDQNKYRYNVIGDCNQKSEPAIMGATADAFRLMVQ